MECPMNFAQGGVGLHFRSSDNASGPESISWDAQPIPTKLSKGGRVGQSTEIIISNARAVHEVKALITRASCMRG